MSNEPGPGAWGWGLNKYANFMYIFLFSWYIFSVKCAKDRGKVFKQMDRGLLGMEGVKKKKL